MRLILVGGFLGSGKTTLLWESARQLTRRGQRVGLITNDQAPNLVDTALLSRSGANVKEVAGSCFCCNFDGFKDAVQSLVDAGASCILAEPVGSCTDLSATILQPLKALFPGYSVAPLTVLIDPSRIYGVLQTKQSLLHPDAAYILKLQLEEADRVVLNKIDSISEVEQNALLTFLANRFPKANVAAISAQTGAGVETWLDAVSGDGRSGTHIVEVDYDRYARGEAVLGWLNTVLELQWTGNVAPHWKAFLERLFEALRERLAYSRSEIGHIKMLLDCGSVRIVANLTGLDGAISLRADGVAEELTATLTVNARVQTSPEAMESLFREVLCEASASQVSSATTAFYCLEPGRPQPTYRYDEVVA